MNLKLSIGTKKLFSTFPGSKQVTVGRVLLSLESSHPDIYQTLCDKEGRLKPSLTVLVNGENIRYRNGLESELREGDEVYIIPIITGG
jgi:molybdopterin converting factor small subunit